MAKDKDLKKLVGSNISAFRKGLGLSQERFAELANISISGLSDIETGANFPRAETFSKIAFALNVEPHELLVAQQSEEGSYERLLSFLDAIKGNKSQIIAVYEYAKSIVRNDIKKNKIT